MQELEVRLGVPVPYLFTGPGGGAFIDRDVSVGIPALRAAGRTP